MKRRGNGDCEGREEINPLSLKKGKENIFIIACVAIVILKGYFSASQVPYKSYTHFFDARRTHKKKKFYIRKIKKKEANIVKP